MRALPYSVIELTQSQWDSGSRIDTDKQKSEWFGDFCAKKLEMWESP